MSEVVLDHFFDGHIGVQTEAEDVVQVGTTNSVKDGQLLRADQGTTGQVASDRQQLTECLAILSVQHVVKDEGRGILVLRGGVHLETVFNQLGVELGADGRGLAEWAIDVSMG